MRLRKITLREIHMPLIAPFQTSFGETSLRRILLVEVDAEGATGWGECTAGEDPYYSYETVETAWHILRDFLWPIVKYKEFDSAAEVFDLLARVRGHNMAKAGLETAIWDAEAKQKNVCRSRNYWAARATKFPPAFPSASSRTSRRFSPKWKKNSPPATSASK